MRDAKLNLKTDREAVREALVQMGDYNPDEKWGYVIYGGAGVSRYEVPRDGRVAFVASSFPAMTEKARSLVFEID
jgi:hypothetical protein